MKFQKAFSQNPVGSVLLLIIVAYLGYMIYDYITAKNSSGYEKMGQAMNKAYANSSSYMPSDPYGNNKQFSSASGTKTTFQDTPSSCNKMNMSDPSALLPKDTNSGWAMTNPSGKAYLDNINLLKAGFNIGIDTVGSSLRNANLQLRSEPINPQVDVSIWNKSTITPDYVRTPLEIGSSISN